MKERFSDVYYVQLFMLISVVSFLVLSPVTLVTFYRLFRLEAEVNLLRNALCEPTLKEENVNENIRYIPKKRRSISEDIRNFEEIDDDSFKSSYPVNHKNDSPKKIPVRRRGHKAMKFNDTQSKLFLVKRSSLDSFTSGEYNIGTIDTEVPTLRDEDIITRRTRQRNHNLDDRYPRVGRIKPLPSIHLSGDTSKYVLGTHQNFNGNGHLRHTQDIFVDWKPNNWVEKTGMMTHFGFDEGYLTIKESGLYLIYAQIYYLDVHDRNGYIVHKNRIPILQCTIDLHTSVRVEKGNTCYTAGVEYVAEGDKISLNDVVGGHYSLFEPGKSFFGAVKLGDIRARI